MYCKLVEAVVQIKYIYLLKKKHLVRLYFTCTGPNIMMLILKSNCNDSVCKKAIELYSIERNCIRIYSQSVQSQIVGVVITKLLQTFYSGLHEATNRGATIYVRDIPAMQHEILFYAPHRNGSKFTQSCYLSLFPVTHKNVHVQFNTSEKLIAMIYLKLYIFY